MNIALLGYGKMGKMIEKVSLNRGHKIVARVDIGSAERDYNQMDVAIDFSVPESAVENIKGCLANGVPVISGTTGWLQHYEEVAEFCKKEKGAFIYSSNFSLGVNIFFELNSILAKMMAGTGEYKVSIDETHHIHKLDAPSGTAITLAEGIIGATDYTRWQLNKDDDDAVVVRSHREGEIPGTHEVTYSGTVDDISIKHTAHNREGFALGAVVAAEWIQGKQGVYSMKDVLNLGAK
ncbi:4-hydroxy-tetrahydrodipicolinate reductase [Muriicola soli]|uniref:4-hydroxy-tetrahydrodipicolinate reductase n=1 Tax=Muriicola soli TaxID=2507538 RepID=A0A411EA29_9FLAO|nr:4-hydroxy-tetrahydrodipicolinate reductase [Muriicola soli]QBA64566.1 4-hydroxy-tetrahydrodipicolinate reductase [Muriicola soli]